MFYIFNIYIFMIILCYLKEIVLLPIHIKITNFNFNIKLLNLCITFGKIVCTTRLANEQQVIIMFLFMTPIIQLLKNVRFK